MITYAHVTANKNYRNLTSLQVETRNLGGGGGPWEREKKVEGGGGGGGGGGDHGTVI